jgi:hypothetical protein
MGAKQRKLKENLRSKQKIRLKERLLVLNGPSTARKVRSVRCQFPRLGNHILTSCIVRGFGAHLALPMRTILEELVEIALNFMPIDLREAAPSGRRGEVRRDDLDELILLIYSPRRTRLPLLSQRALESLVAPGIKLADRHLVVPIHYSAIFEVGRARGDETAWIGRVGSLSLKSE